MTIQHLDSIFYRTTDLWPQLAGKSISVCGLGFYGSAFADTLTYVRDIKGIDLSIHVWSKRFGWDITRNETYQDALRYSDYVINCVGDSNAGQTEEELFPTHIAGPINLRNNMKLKGELLHFSSGAAIKGDTPYAKAKRQAENHLQRMSPNVQIVRPFATVGPNMSLDSSFAVPTFMKRALAGQSPEVSSRKITRSFCHITDLVVQCLHVMVAGDHVPYEVGSDDPLTIEEAARLISDDVKIVEAEFPSNAALDRYITDLSAIKEQFNISLDMDSKRAILDTWHSIKNSQAK